MEGNTFAPNAPVRDRVRTVARDLGSVVVCRAARATAPEQDRGSACRLHWARARERDHGVIDHPPPISLQSSPRSGQRARMPPRRANDRETSEPRLRWDYRPRWERVARLLPRWAARRRAGASGFQAMFDRP